MSNAIRISRARFELGNLTPHPLAALAALSRKGRGQDLPPASTNERGKLRVRFDAGVGVLEREALGEVRQHFFEVAGPALLALAVVARSAIEAHRERHVLKREAGGFRLNRTEAQPAAGEELDALEVVFALQSL